MSEPRTLLRFADLEERGIVRNREQLRILVRDHGFPPGWMLSPNARVWDAPVIDEWLQGRRDASSGRAGVQQDQAVTTACA
jgi:hypothetical protein